MKLLMIEKHQQHSAKSVTIRYPAQSLVKSRD